MAQALEAAELTLADLAERFGPMPASRVWHQPPPGTAVEQDAIEVDLHADRLCELIDGVLLEKAPGFYESYLSGLLVQFVLPFAQEHDLGIVLASNAMYRLSPGQVRIPDGSFVSWSRMPGRVIPRDDIADFAPDLAIEVLSKGNTKQEMARKLDDYFAAGVRLVWYVDPKTETVQCYTSPHDSTLVKAPESLDGGAVLPGFTLPLDELFKQSK
ncbi:MAG TPA: Uma2 family endonuclease [Pirellulales bacterium]|nr:Uma2 family endonuclease [Pirellulales bacterium]